MSGLYMTSFRMSIITLDLFLIRLRKLLIAVLCSLYNVLMQSNWLIKFKLLAFINCTYFKSDLSLELISLIVSSNKIQMA